MQSTTGWDVQEGDLAEIQSEKSSGKETAKEGFKMAQPHEEPGPTLEISE